MCFKHGFLRVFLDYISHHMCFPIFARIYTMNLKHLTHTGSPSVIIKEEMPYILISWWTTGTDLRSRLSGSQSQYTGCNVTCPLRRLPGPCVRHASIWAGILEQCKDLYRKEQALRTPPRSAISAMRSRKHCPVEGHSKNIQYSTCGSVQNTYLRILHRKKLRFMLK